MCSLLLCAGHLAPVAAFAATPEKADHQWSTAPDQIDDYATFHGIASSALFDTVWIADWTFEGGSPCDDSGWEARDANLVYTGQELYWSVGSDFAGIGAIVGASAILSHHDLCWVFPDGYDNNWYQAVALPYGGGTLLSCDYLVDSEDGFDFFQIEVDSACASLDNSALRTLVFSDTGLNPAGHVEQMPLPYFSTPDDTHCVYLAFFTDGAFSPADGRQPTTLGAGLVLDHVELEDAGTPGAPALVTLFEDFEAALDPRLEFVLFPVPGLPTPGLWARVYDVEVPNDPCRAGPTCSWGFNDPAAPCNNITMPQGCVPRGIDNVVISPWVGLSGAPGTNGTLLWFRELPGQVRSLPVVRNWAVRSRVHVDDTDTPMPGDSLECTTGWEHAFSWNTVSGSSWRTVVGDMAPHIDPAAVDVQVRFRIGDWQWIAGREIPGPTTGPGPFIDRVRIGRRTITGPLIGEGIDSRSQAQDTFATEIDPTITPGAGEHYRPTTDIFGSCAFSNGADLGAGTSPNLITGDSIHVEVIDVRDTGGIASVDFYGAIVHGVHAGKSPPPWSVDANGFFHVPADTVRNTVGSVVDGHWFVDLDDDYFRAGDVLHYFWMATDAGGGMSSLPVGLEAVPVSVAAAQDATGGLFEVSFLPEIHWASDYMARVQSDPHGKLEPTPDEIAASEPANCVLYAQSVNPRRRAGDLHRTSFMYTMYPLGFRGSFDTYDVQGYGNTNNQLGGRASVEQAESYSMIVYDAGNLAGPILPDGSDIDSQKIDQAGWFQSWLAQISTSTVGFGTLWILGTDVAEERAAHPLLANEMGVALATPRQTMGVSPDVEGQTSFAFDVGENVRTVDFTEGTKSRFSVVGGCLARPTDPINPARPRDYDGLDANGTGVVVYRYRSEVEVGEGAIVMNSNSAGNWNTILCSFAWMDMHGAFRAIPNAPFPALDLFGSIVNATTPRGCPPNFFIPVDVPDSPRAPLRTALHANSPNPFNPVTTIHFDLARKVHVELRIYDVAGHLVRTLIDATRDPGQHRVTWDGLDDAGRSVPSGVYVDRLRAAEYQASRKLVVLR